MIEAIMFFGIVFGLCIAIIARFTIGRKYKLREN